MKIVVYCIAFLLYSVAFAEVPSELLNNGYMGTEFYFAFPLNDSQEQPDRGRELYIASNTKTRVQIEITSLGWKKDVVVDSGKVRVLSTIIGGDNLIEVGFAGEIETVLQGKSFHITSQHPVSIYALNGKQVTADGTPILPIHSWGKEYYHCSYWDFNEFRPWAGGFVILAAENNTEVTVNLRGTSTSKDGATVKGNTIGTSQIITLNKGDIYLVQGNGKTRGQFDLSGSFISATKPIGVISYHNRTIIPISDGSNSRDHLLEMMVPVHAAGTEFISSEFERHNKGDFFRIVATQPDTYVDVVTSYNLFDSVSRNSTYLLRQAGDVVSIGEGPSSTTIALIGYSYWKSNKPIIIMQYNYSSGWDGDSRFDPSMHLVSPIQQMASSVVVQTPSNSAYNTNNLVLVAKCSDADTTKEALKSITLDGVPVTQTQPFFLSRKFPGKPFYLLTKPLKGGMHTLRSSTQLSAFVYGYSSADSYSWSGGSAANLVDMEDLTPPKIQKQTVNGILQCVATELVAKDVGISSVQLFGNPSYQLELDSTALLPSKIVSKITQLDFSIKKIGNLPDTLFVLVRDRAGNVGIDTIVPIFSVPKSPTLYNYIDTTISCSYKPLLEWEDVAATKYKVQISESPQFDRAITIVYTTEPRVSQLLSTVLGQVTLYWRVRAINNTDSSAWSNVGKITLTNPQQIQITRPVQDEKINVNIVQLRWVADQVSEKYLVVVLGDPIRSTQTFVVDTNLLVLQVQPKTRYSWWVRPICGDSAYPTPATSFTYGFVTDDILSSVEEDGALQSLYPNPVANHLTVPFTSAKEIAHLYVYNSIGVQQQVPMQQSTQHYTLDVSAIASGLYTLHIRYQNGEQKAHTFVVQH